MSERPSRTISFLFTDPVDSTRLWEKHSINDSIHANWTVDLDAILEHYAHYSPTANVQKD